MGSLRVALAVALITGVAGVAPDAGQASQGSCLRAPTRVVGALRHGLRPSAHVRIGSAYAVRAHGRFTGVLSGGVYFVSARLGARGVATWAVTTTAFRTGRGGIFSVDRTARAVSAYGALISPQLLASWGAGSRTRGYAASRACA